MHNLIIGPHAESDRKDRVARYELIQPGLGERFNTAVENRFEVIRANPYQFGILERDVRVSDIIKFREFIYYRIAKDAVRVLAIIHGKQHPSAWKRRRR